MPTFNALNRDWSIRFDGLLLGDLRDSLGIDLADIAGGAWVKAETDQTTLTKAICFLCRDQLDATKIDQRQLAEALCGETAEQAMQALWGAAKLFFRPRLLSALESACAQRREMTAIVQAMAAIDSLPASIREAALMTLAERMNGALQSSTDALSVSGQDANLSKPAADSPDSAESAHAA